MLKKLFDDAGLILVDFKWSLVCTKVKWYWAMSSPRTAPPVGQRNAGENGQRPFPPELGGLIEAYEAVARRLGVQLDDFSGCLFI